mgnify:CR=1 FL=1
MLSRRKSSEDWTYVNRWYLLIPFAFLAVLFIAPLLYMGYMSFFEFNGVGKPMGEFTLKYYQEFITNPSYWIILGRTVLLGLISTVICVVLGYPLAYKIARMQGKQRSVLVAMVVLPLWVSMTIRMFGWMSILSANGVVATVLQLLFPNAEIKLLGTYGAILIGLIHCGLPYFVMIMIGPIENVNSSYEEASYVFGAGFLKTFFKVTLPLTLKGAMSGAILVFALNTAAFLVPMMLGSGKVIVMTNTIYQQATYLYNWSFAAALAVIFMACALLITNLSRLVERSSNRLTGEKR